MAETYRWLITGILKAVSPLRIGDGHSDKLLPPSDGESPEVATVFRDAKGRAYLPGTTLKGALRDLSASDEAYRDEVFGFQSQDKGCGGLAEFWDAFATDRVPGGNPGPYWNPKRLTCISANTAIDRHTKTPAHRKLFHFEYVPEGVEFLATLSAKSMTEAQAQRLLGLLALLAGRGTGSGGADGWGRLAWTPVAVRRMGETEVGKWIASGGGPLDEFWKEVRLTPEIPAAATAREVEFTVELQFEGGFLVNDPSRCGKASDGRTNHAPWTTSDGRPHLPVSSLRGALRSQAEKIWRTRHPEGRLRTVSPRGEEEPLLDITEVSQVKSLDPICAIFGAPGWRSPISFTPISCVTPGVRFVQDFVAIDRFTGGVAGEAKFNAEAFWRPSFSTSLRVNVERFEASTDEGAWEESWMLLAMALRDLAEGDVQLGFGAAKGYGACTATIRLSNGQSNIPPQWREWFAPGFRPAPEGSAPGRADATSWFEQSAGADQFYNPYAFAPVGAARASGITTSDLQAGATGHINHLRYASGTYSGRIDCRLTAETPFFIGAQPVAGREGEEPKPIANFVLPDSGDPAIPAATLRGMFSAVAEAASGSALRVLNNPAVYSYRNPAASTGDLEQIPTAVGMICQGPSPGVLVMRPLCLPIFKENSRANTLTEFRRFFPNGPVLRSYLGGDTNPIRSEKFLGAVANYPPGVVDALPLEDLAWGTGDGVVPSNSIHYTKAGRVALAQNRSQNARRRNGLIRLLGCTSGRQVPANKKHEMFIPMDDVARFDPKQPVRADNVRFLTIPTEVIRRFERLADEMSEQWKPGEDPRPYEPIGTRPQRNAADPEARKLRLAAGDVVFFRVRNGAVTEVTFSQIWRREVSAANGAGPERAHDFFAQIDRDLLPMNRQRLQDSQGRPRAAKITPAEALFGFVEDQDGYSEEERKKIKVRPNHALSGRVRFSAGTLETRPERLLLPEVPLKILSSPKPPSPAMYFRRARTDQRYGSYFVKPDLKGGGAFLPKGRKGYLHHLLDRGSEPWRSANSEGNNQKVRVRPVNAGASFCFHVDFDNLSAEELGLLLYSLRPSAGYRHKIGMGKALGLGTVRIDAGPGLAVERIRRYAGWDSLREPRWSALNTASADVSAWRSKAVEYLGSTRFRGVSYPLVRGMAGTEGEHFKWFVANDAAYGKIVRGKESWNEPAALEPLTEDNPRVEPLPRHHPEKSRD